MIDGATTMWERMSVSADTAKYLRDTHSLWSRLMNGEHFFAAIPDPIEPVNGLTLGYHSITDALKSEGLL